MRVIAMNAFTGKKSALLGLAAILGVSALNSSGCAGTGQATSSIRSLGSLSVTPGSVAISVAVGGASTQTLTATNVGTAAVMISRVTVTGTGFSLASSSSALPSSLSPGQSQTFKVKFAATTAGKTNGQLSIAEGGNQGLVMVPLLGSTVTSPTPTSPAPKSPSPSTPPPPPPSNPPTTNPTPSSPAPSTPATPGVTSVSVSPATARSITTGTLPFTATVQGTTTNKAATWTASAGSITSAGVFTAPSKTGTVTVTATSSADHTKSATATVTVVAETTPPPTTPPPPASSDALNGELFSHNWNQPKESHVPSVPFTGMRLWNTGTAWSDIETSKGVYSWARLDSWLAIAGEHDKDVLFTIGNTPVWAGGGPGLNNPPSDMDSGDELFKAYVTAVVKHSLASKTGHIKYYETWNEPDITTAWSGSQTQMIKLATDLYTIVHSLDPSAQVVSPPPSTYNAWMLSYFTAGGYVPMDVIGVHGYPGGKYTEPIKIPTLMGHLHDLRTQFNLTQVPVFVTEGSWGNDSTHGVSGLTNDEEIAYVAQMYLFMWNGGMTRFYWYSWDGIQPDGTQGYGQLWTPTGGVKPAGTAYGLLYKWLVGSTTVGTPCSEGTDGTWVCNLTLENKAPARIVWNTNGSTTYSAKPFVSYQTLDNETVHLVANGTVTINTKPILLY
jgi:hypothetical protein